MQQVRSPFPTGTIIEGRYVVEEVLGTGGFSAVYLVKDREEQGNLFALKEVIDPDKRELESFAFECEVLTRLEHPALPHVFRVFRDDEHHRAYMLMNYVEGPNLETLRQQQPGQRFSLPQALAIVEPIMDAVAYLHRQDPPIIHRDIKPANIIVPTKGGTPALVDFGIAKKYEAEGTTTAVRHCSAGYSAPEQYTRGTGPRSDIYALAATLYTLLAGQVPADALHRMMELSEGRADPLIPLHWIVPSVPRAVSQAIQRGLSLNRNTRFPTVEAFRRALHAGSREQAAVKPALLPVPGHRVVATGQLAKSGMTQAASGKRPTTRRSWLLGALILIILGFVIGLGIGAAFLSYAGAGGQRNDHAALPASPKRARVLAPAPTSIGSPEPAVTSTASVSASSPAAAPPAVPTPVPTPASPGYPHIAGLYQGVMYDTPQNQTVYVSNIRIQQSGGNISGSFTVNSSPRISGVFTGTVDTSGHVRFIVLDNTGRAALLFTGSVEANGAIVGNFCALDGSGYCSGQYGTWKITPASP